MVKFSGFMRSIHDHITMAVYWIGILCLLFILSMFCYEIISRYFFRSPTYWVSDYSGYALLFSTFFLAPKITKDLGHIQITFLQDAFSAQPRSVLNAFLFTLAAVACLWAGWYAVEEAMRQYERNVRTMAVMSVPRWWMSAAIAYGFLNSALYFLRHAFTELRGKIAATEA